MDLIESVWRITWILAPVIWFKINGYAQSLVWSYLYDVRYLFNLFKVGETGAGWDRGCVGQRGFEYVPDIEKI